MGRRRLQPHEKRSRLARQIEEYFASVRKEPLSFGEILNKYATIGESCDTVAERLRQMTKGEITILHSTFGYAVNEAIMQKRTKFRIKARTKHNPLRKPGSGRPPQNCSDSAMSINVDGKKRIIKLDKISSTAKTENVEVNFTCTCGAHYTTPMVIRNGNLGLASYRCQSCRSFGSAQEAKFKLGRKTHTRILVDTEIEGLKEEVEASGCTTNA